MIGSAQQFGELYRREAAKWAKVVQAVGLTSE
jgi:hypothetical protein